MIEILTILTNMQPPFAFAIIGLALGIAVPACIVYVNKSYYNHQKMNREYELEVKRMDKNLLEHK